MAAAGEGWALAGATTVTGILPVNELCQFLSNFVTSRSCDERAAKVSAWHGNHADVSLPASTTSGAGLPAQS